MKEQIAKIKKGDTGDLKVFFDKEHLHERRWVAGFHGYAKPNYRTETYAVKKSCIKGRGIYIRISESSAYIYVMSEVGFSFVKSSNDLTKNEMARSKQDNKVEYRGYRNAAKNFKAFNSKKFDLFKRQFRKKNLLKMAAALRLYNQCILKHDTEGMEVIANFVNSLE